VSKSGGLWITYHCDLLVGFVCEAVAGFEPPTTLAPPTDAPDVDCHDGESDGWLRRPGNMKNLQTSHQLNNYYFRQGTLTEGEGSIWLNSSLR